MTVVETELFSADELPEELKDQTRLIDAVFRQSLDVPFSQAISGFGETGYYFFELIKEFDSWVPL